ncbi:OmpA family protein [Marinobacter sp.]|uniref:OmpA family protein n=1 Tax=Marinobacter sp. TaxID=50741 RepID=UPI0034A41320
MSIMRPLTLAALAATLATPALADREQTIYLNPFAGYQLFDDKRDLSETGTFGVGAEYRFLPNWAVELVYSRADADRKYRPGSSDFDELRLDGTYYFAGQDETWNPYVSLGAGHVDFGDDVLPLQTAGSDHDETRVNLGVGVRYNVTDNVSIRGDLREFHGIDESTFDTMASLGLSFAFNRTVSDPAPKQPADADSDGVPDSRDQCPGTPAGASVDNAGCERDGDNDGIADSKDQCPATTAGADVDQNGCEGVTETVETIELSVQFPNNSSVIDDTFDAEIRKVADFLAEHPETSVEIAGHSDSTGEAEYNRYLSERRAEAVANRLTQSLGVDEDRVSATGYGEAEPIASNDTQAGRTQNRRVEARIQVSR